MILKCMVKPCDTESEAQDIETVIARYLRHVILHHWDVLQFAHDHPEILESLTP